MEPSSRTFGIVIAALLVWMLTIAFPRYDWRTQSAGAAFPLQLVRIDRWTGRAELGVWVAGQWMAQADACRRHAIAADTCQRAGL